MIKREQTKISSSLENHIGLLIPSNLSLTLHGSLNAIIYLIRHRINLFLCYDDILLEH